MSIPKVITVSLLGGILPCSLLISVLNAGGYSKQLSYVSGLEQQRVFPSLLMSAVDRANKSLREGDLSLLTLREIWGILHCISFIFLAKKQRESTQMVQGIF